MQKLTGKTVMPTRGIGTGAATMYGFLHEGANVVDLDLDEAVRGKIPDTATGADAIAPGMIRAPMTTAMFEDAANRAEIRKAHPVGREGSPEKVAAAIAFPMSGDASFVTGILMPIDGGITVGGASF